MAVAIFLSNQLEINIYSILNISSIQNGYILIPLATYGFCFTKTYIVNIEAMIIIQQWQQFGRKKGGGDSTLCNVLPSFFILSVIYHVYSSSEIKKGE